MEADDERATIGFAVPAGLAALALRYELYSEIGRGGMGIVYKARDRHTGDIVAIMGIDCASGETYSTDTKYCTLESMFVPKPVIKVSVTPVSRADADSSRPGLQPRRHEHHPPKATATRGGNAAATSGVRPRPATRSSRRRGRRASRETPAFVRPWHASNVTRSSDSIVDNSSGVRSVIEV